MRLDMELILSVLKYAEKHGNGRAVCTPKLKPHSQERLEYHFRLCHEAGYLRTCETCGAHHIVALTWQDHEALESLREAENVAEWRPPNSR